MFVPVKQQIQQVGGLVSKTSGVTSLPFPVGMDSSGYGGMNRLGGGACSVFFFLFKDLIKR